MLYLEPFVTEAVSNAILITGSARSGTTLLGNLIHSLQDIDYSFEPPFLFSLMPMINQMTPDLWKLLYETYLFEDQYMEALSGRRLNFNQNDDSYIYRVKSRNYIDSRINSYNTRKTTLVKSRVGRIAYKMPDAMPYIGRLQQYYPNMHFVIAARSSKDVVSSLLRKSWFSDKNLAANYSIWPSQSEEPPSVPFWVPIDDVESWKNMREIERCYYYYCITYENTLVGENCVVINYDEMIESPYKCMGKILSLLNCKSTCKTQELIKRIVKTTHTCGVSLDDISPSLKERVTNVEARTLLLGSL